jgi:hypothetical protein
MSSLLISPPVSARHVEYRNVWLHPHRAGLRRVHRGLVVNTGINEFMFVLKPANYILPARAQRSFPLLPGRARAGGAVRVRSGRTLGCRCAVQAVS